MPQPTMLAVAGPPGSGKSALFPVESLPNMRGFNVDRRCAELNGGSFHGIPPHIRAQAGAECEAFVMACIQTGQSFAVETTLRTQVSLRQAALAKRAGFSTELVFISTDDVEENIRRIKARATLGGHSASPATIRATYFAAHANLLDALLTFDLCRCFDNTDPAPSVPQLICIADAQTLTLTTASPPRWLARFLPDPIPSPLSLTDLLPPTRH